MITPQVSGICLVGGFLLLAHSHNRKHHVANLLKRGFKAEGRVIEMRRDPGSLFGKAEGEGRAPVVEYRTQSGNLRQHYSTTYRVDSKYSEGQIVTIWYEDYKSRREAALADDEMGDLPRKLFVIGSCLFFIGILPMFSALPSLF